MHKDPSAAEATAQILDYWFGPLEGGWPAQDRKKLWFKADPADDAHMRKAFGPLIADAVAGKLDAWLENPDSTIALVLLADQMTRSTGRGTAEAYAGDPVALAASKKCVDSGAHMQLPGAWRMFCYLPLQHSEVLADQDRCVELFAKLAEDYPDKAGMLAGPDSYAESHRKLIQRFGRFPHRNALLGRESTEAEAEYLASSSESYGQKSSG